MQSAARQALIAFRCNPQFLARDFMTTLFDPIKIGRLTCPNRIWMAPLTRGRGTREHVPTDLVATYYSQRASAGVNITEGTSLRLHPTSVRSPAVDLTPYTLVTPRKSTLVS